MRLLLACGWLEEAEEVEEEEEERREEEKGWREKSDAQRGKDVGLVFPAFLGHAKGGCEKAHGAG